MLSKTLAIIDLGTNTFHLLIARIDEREDFSIQEKFKEPVRMGEGGITSGKISPAAFQRGIVALKKFKKLIEAKNADEVRAFATSAIRSASNGEEFVRVAKAEAGIDIRIIGGNEEAALIYDGVRNGVQLPYEKDCLIIDIGGGSVEFIVVKEGKPKLLRSLSIGAARMVETIQPHDPISKKELEKTQGFLLEKMGGLLEELKEFKIELLIGSSGSFESMAAMVAMENEDVLSSSKLNSYRLKTQDFLKIYDRLIVANHKEKRSIPGMDPNRVDMIVMAASVLKMVVNNIQVKEMMCSLYALKEGILYNYIGEQKARINQFVGNADRNLRAKSIKNLCEKYNYKQAHSLKVNEFALSIFDQSNHLHPFGSGERELLSYAALMHDIGYHINRSGHHKHGQYIIMSSPLSGFSHDEIIFLGNIVRYHRKALPSRDHFHYKVLKQQQRFMVRLLAGILRIADHLDRGGRNNVARIALREEDKRLLIEVFSKENADIEIQSAMAEKELLEQALDLEIVIFATES